MGARVPACHQTSTAADGGAWRGGGDCPVDRRRDKRRGRRILEEALELVGRDAVMGLRAAPETQATELAASEQAVNRLTAHAKPVGCLLSRDEIGHYEYELYIMQQPGGCVSRAVSSLRPVQVLVSR